jgi:protein dithiol oxidoreductase (disulfide-forming)
MKGIVKTKGALMKLLKCAALAAALTLTLGAPVRGATWTEGVNYFLIEPVRPTSLPAGKVEVTEVFSYACPACNHFYPTIDKLKAALPANAELTFVAAAFNAGEDWPMFQRAFYTAQVLGVDKRTHDAMFDAIWKTGELAIIEPGSQRLKSPAPSIEDAAKWYAKTAGIKADSFVSTAASFGVDTKTRQADQYIREAQVDQTPTMIVNGKYRVTVSSAGGDDKVVELVLWLVAREGGSAPKSSTH